MLYTYPLLGIIRWVDACGIRELDLCWCCSQAQLGIGVGRMFISVPMAIDHEGESSNPGGLVLQKYNEPIRCALPFWPFTLFSDLINVNLCWWCTESRGYDQRISYQLMWCRIYRTVSFNCTFRVKALLKWNKDVWLEGDFRTSSSSAL